MKGIRQACKPEPRPPFKRHGLAKNYRTSSYRDGQTVNRHSVNAVSGETLAAKLYGSLTIR